LKLEKAIEILNHIQIPLGTAEDHDRFDAIKLGIEALKCIRTERWIKQSNNIFQLPGETI